MSRPYTLLLCVVLLGACNGDGLPGGKSCGDLNEAECRAASACHPLGCPGCHGESGFAFCARADENPPIACPAIACVACSSYSDSSSCSAAGCAPATCPDCKGGKIFVSCFEPSTEPAPNCPGFCPVSCNTLDEAACGSSAQCHPVYRDPGDCACASLGCCTMYDHCGEGDRANCAGPASCLAPTPQCEGDYVVSYTGVCYEGCAKKTDCL